MTKPQLLMLAAGSVVASGCASSAGYEKLGATLPEVNAVRAKCQMKADEGILIPGLSQHWMDQCMQAAGYQKSAKAQP
jgi:hypothetical protein